MKKQTFLSTSLLLLTTIELAACSPQAINSPSTTRQVVASSITKPSIDWDKLPNTEVTLDNKGLTITEPGTYVLKGETTAGVTVNSSGTVRIILAGATISATDGPAIMVEEAKTVQLELQDGSQNTVKDSSQHSDENLEGAIHSKADPILTGSGNLTLEANYQDGIVSTDNLFIKNGTIQVTTADDAIRGNDSVTISGRNVDITATGDGIKANNDEEADKGTVTINGGILSAKVGDDGIKAESSLVINDGTIDISHSTEGLEGTNVTIKGGNISVYATDDGINAASDAQGADIYIAITGGDIQIEVGPGDTDGFDANGDIDISGGTIAVTTGQSAFDFDGEASLTEGTVTVNGEQITEITATGPGAPGQGGRGVPGHP